MKNWLTSLNGAIALSVIAFLTFLGRAFMEWAVASYLTRGFRFWEKHLMKPLRLLSVLFSAIAGLLLLILLALSVPVRAAGGSLFVKPSGSGTICSQVSPCSLPTALGQASNGDTIYVATGTYTRTGSASNPVVQLTKSITFYGGWDGTPTLPVVRDPRVYPTTLDGEGQRRVVQISGIVTPTFDGFIVTRGSRAEGAGIGVYSWAAPIIRNNVIISNTATGGWGGGIQADQSQALIEHNVIMSNITPYEGGGIASAFDSRLIIKNNLIIGNLAGVSGAGIRLRDVEVVLINNTIAHNTGSGGDGVYATSLFTTTLTAITLTNNIIVSNAYGVRVENDGGISPTLSIDHNIVWSNTGANYIGVADPTGSSGNLSANPLFVAGVYGAYYLSQVAAGQAATSPAVDAGSDLAANLGLHTRTTRVDILGDTGIVDLGYHFSLPHAVYLPVILK